MNKKFFLIFLLIIILSNPVYAAEESDFELNEVEYKDEIYLIENYAQFRANYDDLNRPVVGLALSGGGARAMVNFGVVKALEEEGIAIDFLAGTSMGAIVSTLYGSGLNTDQMLEVVGTTSFGRLIDLSFSGSSGSLVDTKKLNLFLEKIAPNQRLENFKIPAALLSFELTQGKKYLATRGRISNVIQSSYSIPFYFPIENRDDKYFIDAGVLEATPAKAAAALGADFVIATTSAAKDKSYKEYNSASSSADRFLNILQENYSKQIIDNYADFLIDIDVSDYTFMDFNRVNRLIKLGYEKTKKRIPALKNKLAQKGVYEVEIPSRPESNLKNVLADLKNDRFIVEGRESNLFLNYGRDQSYFDQELIVPFVDNFQSGLKYKNDKFLIAFKGDEFFDEGYEALIEYKKLTERTDISAAYANDYQNETKDDYRLEINYFGDYMRTGFGYGRQRNEEYLLLTNRFSQINDRFHYETENDLVYNKDRSETSILSSNILDFKLNDKWSLAAEIIYNNTDVLDSPLVYRGQSLADQTKFQAVLDFKYNHHLIDPLYFGGFLQTTDIGGYLFADYYKDEGESGEAAGIGFNSQLYVLGLSPVALDLYFAYNFEKEDDRVGLELNYNF